MIVPAWHTLCTLRDDVKNGTLNESEFAADLYKVRTGDAPDVYCNPEQFFSRTFATHPMKELVREVLQRLGGIGGNPILRLQVAYGGGKTHSLITLLHLVEHGVHVASNQTVQEFLNYAGMTVPPQARVALLPFDKLDVHHGLEVIGPDGSRRIVMTPWGALAYQLAGDYGFARVQQHEITYTAPAQPILEELLRVPLSEGKGALILLDEAVIYGRSASALNPNNLGVLKDFFQMLTQAVAATPRACIVASLIAAQTEPDDLLGAQVLSALEDVFGRLQSTSEPVGRDDLATVLSRRLFEHLPSDAEKRPIVEAILGNYRDCKQLRDGQKDDTARQRLLKSYPFHPDILDVFYEKWTELPKFQRTRGALRLFALALKHSVGRDFAPFVGVSTILGPDNTLSPAMMELTRICSDKDDVWTPKLNGEIERAREVQEKTKSLTQREIEQAVLAVFLHSQPQRFKADNSELYAMLLHPGIDIASLEAGLDEWRTLSWFLEESSYWRLITTPNLTSMHVNQVRSLSDARIMEEIRTQIKQVRALAAVETDGVERGVQPHFLPDGPKDVTDNTDLHYLVLGPECALYPTPPIPDKVLQYFTTTSGSQQNPRTYRNTIIALAPDFARMGGLKRSVMDYLGWQMVENSEDARIFSAAQKQTLIERKRMAQIHMPSTVLATYSIMLDMGENGNVRAQTLKSADSLGIVDPRPFARIKAMLSIEERLITGNLTPELLLPGSYYELWQPDEKMKTAKDLLASFAQFPRLPRFLSVHIFREALARGCSDGVMVLRLPRPDGTARTYWRVRPTNEEMARSELEVWPAPHATLMELDIYLITPEQSPDIWEDDSESVSLTRLRNYFDGVKQPAIAEGVLESAIQQVVQQGLLCARTSKRAYFKELLPPEELTDTLDLLAPPAALSPRDLLPVVLPNSWTDNKAFLVRLYEDLSSKLDYTLPWSLFIQAVTIGISQKLFEVTEGKAFSWSPNDTPLVTLRLISKVKNEPPKIKEGPATLTAEAMLSPYEMQRLGELVEKITSTAPTLKLSFNVLVTAEGGFTDDDTVSALNILLAQATNKMKFEK